MQDREHYPHMDASAWSRRLDKCISKSYITQSDYDIITEYLEYKNVKDNISPKRMLKITQHLVTFRYKWSQVDYRDITSSIWIKAASHLLNSEYKQNTKHDYIAILKGFLYWGIKKHHFSLTMEDVEEVGTPTQQAITKAPEDLLTDNEVYDILLSPITDPCMAAMIATLYWTGARIGEVLRLRWKDMVFGDRILQIRITDTKTNKQRYAPCCEAVEFVAFWRSKYPNIDGGPVGDNFVFISRWENTWRPMSYSNAAWHIEHLGDKILNRHIHPHLFRASNITNCAAKGVPDAVIKETHWGNQSTTRLKTYLLLKNEAVDEAMYKRAGIPYASEVEKPKGPIQCKYCRAMNVPNSSYCRMCGQPLTQHAQDSQNTISEAVEYVNKTYTIEEMIQSMASVLGITTDKAKQILMGGL